MVQRLGENIPFKNIQLAEPLHKMKPQPDFPAVDLSESNKHLLTYMFNVDTGSESHAKLLEGYQRQVHFVATQALKTLDLAPRYDKSEYRAFTQGFATFEAMADIVRSDNTDESRAYSSSEYDMSLAVRRTEELFVGKPNIGFTQSEGKLNIATTKQDIEKQLQEGNPLAPYDLGVMYDAWCNERPNTYGVILDTAPSNYPTLDDVRARLMGARVAYQLQLPSVAA